MAMAAKRPRRRTARLRHDDVLHHAGVFGH
jgi:hypothetical protein